MASSQGQSGKKHKNVTALETETRQLLEHVALTGVNIDTNGRQTVKKGKPIPLGRAKQFLT
jgi:hypothetical protein